jgi:arginase family enzyme
LIQVKTSALFFPFDLFGSPGAGTGAELLADAFEEMLTDNKREQVATRAQACAGQVRMRRFSFETLATYQCWRTQARRTIRRIFQRPEFLLWVTGNHLGALPVYEELGASAADSLVVQLDAHLDIYNLSDCTSELSHGNFLLHSATPLPTLINLGHRELLLRPEYVRRYYLHDFPASELAVNPETAIQTVHAASRSADRVFVDIDCDVLDPAFFPAVSHPLPFGLSPSLVLRILDAAWSDRVAGVALSEFDPSRDRNDQSLSTLVWLLEYLLLRQYEPTPPPAG